ncbi:hypothetical protein [Lactococcus lactis]|uniref:Uncharacterized protein n=1 Tax=Lactococcus lactis TaxID=1358 RepID=A0AAP4DV67_9LACT|nr:hypothetical protein [Lactococcus lactis]MDG4970102.1 hypothetical protein [Lactococcus lactis]MDG4977612.1 hypothetical protein [Lactococcus lactis]MDG5103960.1 hypothetical protein [Lactococcus lactis]
MRSGKVIFYFPNFATQPKFYQILDQEYETKKTASEEVLKEVNSEAQPAVEEQPIISEAETVWNDQMLLEEVFKYGSGWTDVKYLDTK